MGFLNIWEKDRNYITKISDFIAADMEYISLKYIFHHRLIFV